MSNIKKCDLDHTAMIKELMEKRIGHTTKCPDCDEVLVIVIPRSVERQNWIDKYGDKNDI